MRGAGDTYFSGKMLAKLGRIIVIADELKRLASSDSTKTPVYEGMSQSTLEEQRNALELIKQECRKVELPSDDKVRDAVERLKSGVQVWLNGTAESRFVYDELWGGLINCGCRFNEEFHRCDNVFPDCPAMGDPGLNFGHGVYALPKMVSSSIPKLLLLFCAYYVIHSLLFIYSVA